MSLSIETDIKKIELNAKLKEDENWEFRAYLKGQDSGEIDKIVHRLNDEVSSQIDCTMCGNCCTKIPPGITEKDMERLAARLNITPDEVKQEYTESFDNELSFKSLPCCFLKDKKCTIYEDRPDDCRSYPHLHKKHFVNRLIGVIHNYSICPIVYNIVERLKSEIQYK